MRFNVSWLSLLKGLDSMTVAFALYLMSDLKGKSVNTKTHDLIFSIFIYCYKANSHLGAVAEAIDAVPVESVVLAPRVMCRHARGHLSVSARLTWEQNRAVEYRKITSSSFNKTFWSVDIIIKLVCNALSTVITLCFRTPFVFGHPLFFHRNN